MATGGAIEDQQKVKNLMMIMTMTVMMIVVAVMVIGNGVTSSFAAEGDNEGRKGRRRFYVQGGDDDGLKQQCFVHSFPEY